jgi:hypothetical protein
MVASPLTVLAGMVMPAVMAQLVGGSQPNPRQIPAA